VYAFSAAWSCRLSSSNTEEEVMQKTEVTTIRLPEGMVRRLRQLAHRLSLKRGKDVTWAALVREALEARLREQNEKGV
jgi:predicted DNA-binding protein